MPQADLATYYILAENLVFSFILVFILSTLYFFIFGKNAFKKSAFITRNFSSMFFIGGVPIDIVLLNYVALGIVLITFLNTILFMFLKLYTTYKRSSSYNIGLKFILPFSTILLKIATLGSLWLTIYALLWRKYPSGTFKAMGIVLDVSMDSATIFKLFLLTLPYLIVQDKFISDFVEVEESTLWVMMYPALLLYTSAITLVNYGYIDYRLLYSILALFLLEYYILGKYNSS